MRKINNNIFELIAASEISHSPLLDDHFINQWGQNNNNIIAHYNSYIQNVLTPNQFGPIEKHPYIFLHENCFNISKRFLLLGTFPPSSYFNNLGLIGLPNLNIQPNNPLPFFYGNENNLWKFLFNFLPNDITVNNIIDNLDQNSISISDVFLYVQREIMKSADDSKLNNLVLNSKISSVFSDDSRIETILFTSGSLSDIFKNEVSALVGFRWILETHLLNYNTLEFSGDVAGNGIYLQFNSNNIDIVIGQQNNGIVWWLKSGNKKIKVINLPSPSGNAQRQMPKSPHFKKWLIFKAMQANIPIPTQVQLQSPIKNYIHLYPDVFIDPPTVQYRSEVYSMALNNTINLI